MSILHLIPVVTSTVSLWFAFDQYFFLGIFLHKDVEPGAKHVLTPYWKTMFSTGLGYVIAPLIGTIASTIAILSTTSTELLRDKGSYPWYIASTFLAAGHFAFVPGHSAQDQESVERLADARPPTMDARACHPRHLRGSFLLGRLPCCQGEDLVGLT